MKVPNALRWPGLPAAALALLLLAGAAPARADLRISDLDIYLNDHEVTVRVVLLDAIPPTFHEGLQRSEEHTSELQSQSNLVCRLLLEKKKKNIDVLKIKSRDIRWTGHENQ